jgi:spore cortex formation protein SpoVR/YcgB (stage V sporulation)
VEKYTDSLENWEKEIVRIVRSISQYFYPQMLTKLMNEGWASFWHYTLMTDLWNEGYINEGAYLEILHMHSNVLHQMPLIGSINPYKLGFSVFSDIKRICEDPLDEDYIFFPEFAGKKDMWLDVIHDAMQNYTDESFILQFLSPKVVRDLELFAYEDNDCVDTLLISAIQSEEDFISLRRKVADLYKFHNMVPHIEVVDYDSYKHIITLKHYKSNDRILDLEDVDKTLTNLSYLTNCRVEIIR